MQQASFMARVDGTGNLDPGNPVWQQAAWEMLEAVTQAIGADMSGNDESWCFLSGCTTQVTAEKKVRCKTCDRVQYCSQKCLKRCVGSLRRNAVG